MQKMLERQDGVDDLCLIVSNNEQAVVKQLKTRLERSKIYTGIGTVLVAVNPYQPLPIYGQVHIKKYQTASLSDTSPHIYGLAERAYRNMVDNKQAQSVIISGESGAGKTESAKLLLHYISSVSGSGNKSAYIKEVILQCNPLLESFGNAKTVRNDNSSRFGKYLELYFDDKGQPVGGQTSNFLLEKTRVTFQQRGERNFHIFYSLLDGAWPELIEQCQLGRTEDYTYTAQSGTVHADNIDDRDMFKQVMGAMKTVNIGDEEQWYIFTALAAILNLGNVQLVGRDAPARCDQNSQYYVQMAAYLLGVDPNNLLQAMTHKKVQMGGRRGSVVNIPQNGDQSTQMRDALAKETYSRIFDLIVARINHTMYPERFARGVSVGILDIYGFEIFKNNSFEQFCINYVNERLQQIFIELTIKGEQREYHYEGLPWKDVPFFDNKVVVDLIEGSRPPGIMRVLDDTCRQLHAESSRAADTKFVEMMKGTGISQHPHLTVHGVGMFTIQHYAGEVRYNTEQFCFKNMDNLFQSLQACMQTSSNPFIYQLWAAQGETGPGRQPTTSSQKIRTSAAQLVRSLMATNPHYIRCIKPNESKRAMHMEEKRVLHQVKYLGLVQNIQVKKAGYSYRAPYNVFYNQFSILMKREYQGTNAVQACQQLCQYISQKYSSDIPTSEWALGKSKIFVSSPKTIFFLEELREERLDPAGYAQKVREHEQADRLVERQEAKMRAKNKKKKACSIQ